MKWFRISSGILGLLMTVNSAVLAEDALPLTQNSWDKPEFVKRFVGSYGFRSETEPTITSEESEVFQEVANFMSEGNVDAAIAKVKSSITDESSAALQFTLGNLYLQESKFDQALQYYKIAYTRFPEFMRAYKNAGLACIQSGNFKDGAKFIVQAIELGEADGNSYGLLGFCYLNQGQYSSALDAYRLAHILKPDNIDWMVGKAQCLMQVGQYKEAVAKFKELLQKQPGRTVFYSSIVNALLAQQNQKEATYYLELVRRMDKADARMLNLLGDIYINNNNTDLAITVYREALAKPEGVKADAYLRMVHALMYQNRMDDVLGLLNNFENYFKGKKLSKSNQLQYLNLKAEIASRMDDREGAIVILEEVVDTDPLNGDALLLLAGFKWDEEAYEEADFYFERAQNVEAVKVNALIEQARMKVVQKDYALAVKLLENAQSLKPQTNVARYLEAVRSALDASR